jgi:hypothetical protein
MEHLTSNNQSNEWSIDGIRPPAHQPRRFSLRNVAWPIAKIALAGMCSALVAVGVYHVGDTVSYFTDIEQSLNNVFVADPLDFSVSLDRDSHIDVSKGETKIVATMTPDEKSDPVEYSVQGAVVGGDAALCGALHVLATAPFPYDGPLASLATATSTDLGSWALTISANGDVSPNTSCGVVLIYRGVSAGAMPGQGYKDVEQILMTFFVPDASSTPVVSVAAIAPDGEVAGTSTEAISTSTPDTSQDTATTSPEIVSSSTLESISTSTAPLETPPADTSVSSTTPSDTPAPVQ